MIIKGIEWFAQESIQNTRWMRYSSKQTVGTSKGAISQPDRGR